MVLNGESGQTSVDKTTPEVSARPLRRCAEKFQRVASSPMRAQSPAPLTLSSTSMAELARHDELRTRTRSLVP